MSEGRIPLASLARWQQVLLGALAVWQTLELFSRWQSRKQRRVQRGPVIKGYCPLNEDGNSGANGKVWLEGGVGIPTRIHGIITGLTPGRHGFHIHEYGNLVEGCKSAGGHYNPLKATHGGPTDDIAGTRHIGDLGNIIADSNGVAMFSIIDRHIKLYGAYSVIGRAIVCHAGEDDLGRGNNDESLKTGNAGARVCCGVIGLAYEGQDDPGVHAA